jgi:hypothetical protein
MTSFPRFVTPNPALQAKGLPNLSPCRSVPSFHSGQAFISYKNGILMFVTLESFFSFRINSAESLGLHHPDLPWDFLVKTKFKKRLV